MCEIAFMTGNRGGNPLKHYRKGDPVEVLEDNADWGTDVDKRAYIAKYGSDVGWRGIFVIVQITDLSVTKAKTYLEARIRPATALDPEFNNPDPEDRFVQVSRKKWGVFIDELPAGFKNTLLTDGFAQVTIAQVKNYFRNKIDGTLISG